MTTQVQWTAPSPFWDEPASAADANVRQAMRQPAILRFVADTFMDDFLSLIETDPLRLKTLVAAPETWRGPGTAPSPPPAVPTLLRPLARVQLARASRKDPALATLLADRIADRRRAQAPPLKLYQPGQQRHYLLTASLVCQQASLPDRTLDTGAGERVTFVMRRLLPGTNNRPSEFAFVKDGQGFVWQPVDSPTSLAAGEEQLPMFSVTFTDDSDRRRRLLAGVVPVGRREAYLGAAPAKTAPVAGGTGTPPRADPIREPRAVMFRAQVIEPWKSLIERAYRTRVALTVVPATGTGPTPTEKQDLLRGEREHMQVVSWYILLDLARLLRDYLPNVYDAVTGTRTRSSLGSRERDVYDVLDDTTLGQDLELALIRPERGTGASAYTASDVKASLLAALRSLLDQVPQADQSKLEKVTEPYDRTGPHSDWPSFLFPLSDPVEVAPLPPNGAAPTSVTNALDRIDQFQDLLAKALPIPGDPGFAAPAAPVPPAPLAAQLPMLPGDAAWFVMRCVFERPNCGPARPAVVSDPTPSFQLAGFFDPDAPARPIRIALPLDTTPAGLRRFDKNTAFMISDTLCGQIDRVKGLSLGDLVLSILPWPFHKDLSIPDGGPCANSLGMICSLSIPIITICALLLLMIIVSLLDIVFRWLPFFIVCFPLPNFGAKRLPAAAPGG